jgi:hypothetical protein
MFLSFLQDQKNKTRGHCRIYGMLAGFLVRSVKIPKNLINSTVELASGEDSSP